MLPVLSGNFRNASFRKRNLKVKRDNSLRKMSSWTVKTDPKGTKKIQMVIKSQSAPVKVTPSEDKKKKKGVKKRKISLLRSSPPRFQGLTSREPSPDDTSVLASSADLRSPRRAPRVAGLDLSPPPPADTPNSMRRRRRSGRGRARGRQLRCRNRGCANTERTFSNERARERHEQESCSMRIQVCKLYA